MKTLITGATGFIGRHLAQILVEEGESVTCLVRETSDTKSLKKMGVTLAYGDILNKDSLKRVVEDGGIHAVFHLAGKVYSTNKQEFYKVNCEGTKNLFDACSHSDVKKFIFLSSLAALGPALDNKELDEKAKSTPLTDYGKSKYYAENYILGGNSKSSMSVLIVRAPLIYGTGMSRESRLYGVLKMAKKGFLVKVGKNDDHIPLCFFNNLLMFLKMLKETNNFSESIYHIRDDLYYDLDGIKEMLQEVLKRKIKIIHIPHNLKRVLMLYPFINKDLVRELGYDWRMGIDALKKEFNFVPDGMFKESLPAILKTYNLL